MYSQLLKLLPLANFYAHIWQFFKLSHIVETAARRAKISSILTTWGRNRVYVQLLELCQWSSFMPKYYNFENWPVSQERLLVQQK